MLNLSEQSHHFNPFNPFNLFNLFNFFNLPQPPPMVHSKIAGIGKYLPERVVTNNDLLQYMDTSDEWIRERTGIEERRYAHRTEETTTTMAMEAAKVAIERAGITAQDIDFIIFARHSLGNNSPDSGLQR